MPKPERPDFCTDDMLEYLDGLRESGVANMFGAARYLDDEYPELRGDKKIGRLSSPNAQAVLEYWMQTFDERHAAA